MALNEIDLTYYRKALTKAKKDLAEHYAKPIEHVHVWDVLDFNRVDQPWVCWCGETKIGD